VGIEKQAEGRKVDARSDIFSFGSVLYEMVTGRQPFQSDSKMSTLTAIIKKDPEPLPSEVPHNLQKLITRCLRKNPDRRFLRMGDGKIALEDLKEESDSGKLAAPPKPGQGSRRFLVCVAGIVAVAAVAVMLWMFRGTSQPPEAAFQPVPLTTYPGWEASPSFSPDGNEVVFSWNRGEGSNSDIYRKLIGPGEPLRLTSHPAREGWPAWPPDGRYIAFQRVLGNGKVGVFHTS
jgi:serine/threonine protein kinase